MSSAAATSSNNHNISAITNTATVHRSQPTTQACAACKYQRRKCNTDCTLAPFFPAERQKEFLNAHRLFGVSNILKIIRDLDTFHRAEAMRSIIIQSNFRAQDPVGGCYRIVCELNRQIEMYSIELANLHRQLAFYQAQSQQSLPFDLEPNVIFNDQNLDPAIHQQQQPYFNYLYYDEAGGDNNSSNSNSNSINNYNNNSNSIENLEMEMSQSMLSLQTEDDVKPLVDMFEDDVKPLLEFNVGNQEDDPDCKGIEMKEDANQLMEHVQEHDLKGAASLFTLTNCHAAST